MRRLLFLSFAVLILSVLPLGAFDLGGTIDNATGLSHSGALSFSQTDKLSLWFAAGLGKTLDFNIQGSYTFSLDRPYLFDLDHLKIGFKPFSALVITLGRFMVSDLSGKVLSHALDGLRINLNLPFSAISIYGGYSGFLQNPNSTIVLTRADDADSSDSEVLFGSSRVIGAVKVLFPDLLFRQDLTLTALLQFDLRPDNKVIQEGEEAESPDELEGGKMDSQYFGLGLSGPLVRSLYYSSYFFLETGRTLSYMEDADSATGFSWSYQQVLSFLGGAGLSWYLEALLQSRLELNGVWAGGDPDYSSFFEGNSSAGSRLFTPISKIDTGLVFSPQMANLIFLSLSYSIKPLSGISSRALKNLQTVITGRAFFRPTAGPISETGLDSASTELYLGTEVSGVVNFRPLSDLGTALSVGLFFPSSLAFSTDYQQVQFLGRLEISYSF